MQNQEVDKPTLRDDLYRRRDQYLLRLTRWERSETSSEGVVQVRRRFAGSEDFPPEAPIGSDEWQAINHRYDERITSYGDWETLKIVRNELNLNRMMAWLVWLKKESVDVKSEKNPFKAKLLKDVPPIFGVLPPQEHLPPLDSRVGFGGVVVALRRCGAHLTDESISAVFQKIAGPQTLVVNRELKLYMGSEIQEMLPAKMLAEEFKALIIKFEEDQALRTPHLDEMTLEKKISGCLNAFEFEEGTGFAPEISFSNVEQVQEALLAAWGDRAGDLLTDLSVNLRAGVIGKLLDWLAKIYAGVKALEDGQEENNSSGWGGWEPPGRSGWDRPPEGGWEPPGGSVWDSPNNATERRLAWQRANQAIAAIADLARLNRISLSEGIQHLVRFILTTLGWPWPDVQRWLHQAAAHPAFPLYAAAMVEYPGIYGGYIHDSDEFQFPPYTPIGACWCAKVLIPSTIGHILALKDTADFHVTDHLRFLYLFSDKQLMCDHDVLPAEIVPFFKAALLRFKYSVEDAHSKAQEEMTFWSENHQVLFASCEYLAGQLWPDADFLYADGAGVQHDGEWHRQRAYKRLCEWLDLRMKLGFSEWNAPGYYNEDIPPLLNLADFCDDPTLRAMALTVLDLLVFDVARFTCQGNFCVTAGRVYLEHKRVAWDQAIGDFIELLFGTRGDFLSPNETTAIAMATSSYCEEVPEVLLAIGQDRASNFRDTSRVSAHLGPVDSDNPGDILRWWGNGAYFSPQTWDATVKWAQRWGLMNTGPFKALKLTEDSLWEQFGLALLGLGRAQLLSSFAILPFPINLIMVAIQSPDIRGILDVFLTGLDLVLEFIEDVWDEFIGWFGADSDDDDAPRLSKTAVLETLKRLLFEFNSGSILSTANLNTFRTADVMLSSAVNHRPGEISFQKQTSVAVVGQNAAIWTTKPLGEANTIAGLWRGTVNAVEKTPLQWATSMAFPWASRPYDGLVEVALPFVKDEFLPGGHDGPNWWTGTVTLPDVWQVDNAAVMLYRPRDMQRSLSKNITHAWFPKEAFDEIRWQPSGDGMWVMGRRDRRFPPQNPRNPANAPLSDDGRNRKVQEEVPGKGSGYVALYSAQGFYWASGDFQDRELQAEGHENIFVTIVGDQAMFGSFEKFVAAVLGCGLTTSVGDMTCSLHIPDGRESAGSGKHLAVQWGLAKVDGVFIDTNQWPRFENKYVIGRSAGRVEAAERRWRIAIANMAGGQPALELLHDADHPERRAFNRQVYKPIPADVRRAAVRGGRHLREKFFKNIEVSHE